MYIFAFSCKPKEKKLDMNNFKVNPVITKWSQCRR